jgi:hypothetical protein
VGSAGGRLRPTDGVAIEVADGLAVDVDAVDVLVDSEHATSAIVTTTSVVSKRITRARYGPLTRLRKTSLTANKNGVTVRAPRRAPPYGVRSALVLSDRDAAGRARSDSRRTPRPG